MSFPLQTRSGNGPAVGRGGEQGVRTRTLLTAVTFAATLLAAWVPGRTLWGQQGQGYVIDADLLKSAPYDQITLIDGVVVKVEPVSPRPLPPYDPKLDKGAAVTKRTRDFREGNVFLPGKEPKKKDEVEQVNEITIHRLDVDPIDFRLRRAHIKRLEYFEDLLVAEAERLVLARDYVRAFEHLLLVKQRNPKWAGLEEATETLLYEEATTALDLDNDVDRGLRLLRELYERRPKYPRLADRLALAYGGRITKAFDAGAYRDARRLLHELQTLAPQHRIVIQARSQFVTKATELVERAEKAEGPERLDLLAAALRVWPDLEGAGAKFREAFSAVTTLDVGVVDVAHPLGPWLRTPADARATRLAYYPVLARDDEEAARGRLPGQLATDLQKADLGRQLQLSLRFGPTWSDGARAVTAIDVVRSLTDRAKPSSPCFNARWAENLERVEAPDERTVVIRLVRAPLKPEAWLLGPLGPAHTGRDGQAVAHDGARRPVTDGSYTWAEGNRQHVTFFAREAGTSPGDMPKIRRVRETRITGGPESVGALLRGEITLLEHVPPDQVKSLTAQDGVQVGRYTRPEMHQIALDGRSFALRNRTLRRGLSYALDRKTYLEETILRRAVDEANGPSDGIFPRDSYANAPGVDPLPYDPSLARMLIAAGVKELGGDGVKLTLEYPARPEPRAIVRRLIEDFDLVTRGTGLKITALERPESELEEELHAGRPFDMAYRVVRCTEPITDVGPMLCPAYDAPPSQDGLATIASPRMLQLLLALEQSPDWPSARALVAQIDREVRDELPVIPLWQLQEHYAWRTRLKGPKDKSDHLYHEIDRWEIEAWYAKDPW
jgi:peptide/nickel transport system substrate-binding protein